MPKGIYDRPTELKQERQAWVPAAGFVETGPGVWVPEGYEPLPFELPTPIVDTEEKAELEYIKCAQSLSYFAFYHAWSIHVDDPVTMQSTWRKFPAYPYLKTFFDTVQVPQNFHVEKTRQMLMSWAWMVVFTWDILFHRNWSNMVLSRKEKEVDEAGHPYDALLGKVWHIWSALPPYLYTPLEFKHMMVRNEVLNSFIRGEVATKNAAHGRANRRALMDEAGLIEHSEEAFGGLRQAAKSGLILMSTPNGKGNVFARIRFNPHSNFKKLSFHWTEHPEKAADLYCTCGWKVDPTSTSPANIQFKTHPCTNPKAERPKSPEPHSPWYDKEVLDMTPEKVASQLDISYEKSRRGRCFSAFDSTRQTIDHQALVGEKGNWETAEDYRMRYLKKILQPGKPCVVGWDFGVGDPTSLLLGQIDSEPTQGIDFVDEYEKADESWEHYHGFVNGLWGPLVKEITGFDLMHYGDPSGKGRGSDLTSWISNLKSRDPRVVIFYYPADDERRKGGLLEWIDHVNNLFRHDRTRVSSYCSHLIDALNNYHYPVDKDTGEPVPGKQEPVHDQWSHACSAFRYIYQFRWNDRLILRDKRVATSKQILRVEDDSVKVVKPPVDSKKLRYFS